MQPRYDSSSRVSEEELLGLLQSPRLGTVVVYEHHYEPDHLQTRREILRRLLSAANDHGKKLSLSIDFLRQEDTHLVNDNGDPIGVSLNDLDLEKRLSRFHELCSRGNSLKVYAFKAVWPLIVDVIREQGKVYGVNYCGSEDDIPKMKRKLANGLVRFGVQHGYKNVIFAGSGHFPLLDDQTHPVLEILQSDKHLSSTPDGRFCFSDEETRTIPRGVFKLKDELYQLKGVRL